MPPACMCTNMMSPRASESARCMRDRHRLARCTASSRRPPQSAKAIPRPGKLEPPNSNAALRCQKTVISAALGFPLKAALTRRRLHAVQSSFWTHSGSDMASNICPDICRTVIVGLFFGLATITHRASSLGGRGASGVPSGRAFAFGGENHGLIAAFRSPPLSVHPPRTVKYTSRRVPSSSRPLPPSFGGGARRTHGTKTEEGAGWRPTQRTGARLVGSAVGLVGPINTSSLRG